ncbi:Uncharacterized protein APZ42_003964, partial [Daphnia magna]
VLTWLTGASYAEAAIKNKKKVTEDQLRTIPAQVSTAILEEDVEKEMDTMKQYFDEDAWEAVNSLLKTMKKLKENNKLGYSCPKCTEVIDDLSTDPK